MAVPRGRVMVLLDSGEGRCLYQRRTPAEPLDGQPRDVLHMVDIPYHARHEVTVERLVVAQLILQIAALLANLQGMGAPAIRLRASRVLLEGRGAG